MSILFDAVDDIIDCGSNATLNNLESQGGGGLSIYASIFPEGTGEGGQGNIVSKDETLNVGRLVFATAVPSRILFTKSYLSGTNLTADFTFTTNVWQNILVTWDGGSTASAAIKFYRDGLIVANSNLVNGFGALATDTLLGFHIGNRSNGARTFDGFIRECAVWNEVLSDYDATLLNSGVSGTPKQIRPGALMGYWALDDFSDGAAATGTASIRDQSGNENHGTPTGNPISRAQSTLSYP